MKWDIKNRLLGFIDEEKQQINCIKKKLKKGWNERVARGVYIEDKQE